MRFDDFDNETKYRIYESSRNNLILRMNKDGSTPGDYDDNCANLVGMIEQKMDALGLGMQPAIDTRPLQRETPVTIDFTIAGNEHLKYENKSKHEIEKMEQEEKVKKLQEQLTAALAANPVSATQQQINDLSNQIKGLQEKLNECNQKRNQALRDLQACNNSEALMESSLEKALEGAALYRQIIIALETNGFVTQDDYERDENIPNDQRKLLTSKAMQRLKRAYFENPLMYASRDTMLPATTKNNKEILKALQKIRDIAGMRSQNQDIILSEGSDETAFKYFENLGEIYKFLKSKFPTQFPDDPSQANLQEFYDNYKQLRGQNPANTADLEKKISELNTCNSSLNEMKQALNVNNEDDIKKLKEKMDSYANIKNSLLDNNYLTANDIDASGNITADALETLLEDHIRNPVKNTANEPAKIDDQNDALKLMDDLFKIASEVDTDIDTGPALFKYFKTLQEVLTQLNNGKIDYDVHQDEDQVQQIIANLQGKKNTPSPQEASSEALKALEALELEKGKLVKEKLEIESRLNELKISTQTEISELTNSVAALKSAVELSKTAGATNCANVNAIFDNILNHLDLYSSDEFETVLTDESNTFLETHKDIQKHVVQIQEHIDQFKDNDKEGLATKLNNLEIATVQKFNDYKNVHKEQTREILNQQKIIQKQQQGKQDLLERIDELQYNLASYEDSEGIFLNDRRLLLGKRDDSPDLRKAKEDYDYVLKFMTHMPSKNFEVKRSNSLNFPKALLALFAKKYITRNEGIEFYKLVQKSIHPERRNLWKDGVLTIVKTDLKAFGVNEYKAAYEHFNAETVIDLFTRTGQTIAQKYKMTETKSVTSDNMEQAIKNMFKAIQETLAPPTTEEERRMYAIREMSSAPGDVHDLSPVSYSAPEDVRGLRPVSYSAPDIFEEIGTKYSSRDSEQDREDVTRMSMPPTESSDVTRMSMSPGLTGPTEADYTLQAENEVMLG